MKKTSDAVAIAYRRYISGRPHMERMVREEEQKLQLAAFIRKAREDAGMSQAELARRIGTAASAISRLEDPDYDGHTLKTLRKVAAALNLNLTIAAAAKHNVKRREVVFA